MKGTSTMATPGEDDLERRKTQADESSEEDGAPLLGEEQAETPPPAPERTEGADEGEEWDEEEEDDGSARPHVQGRGSKADASRGRGSARDAFKRSLASKSNAELRALYVRACVGHEREVNKGRSTGKHFSLLTDIRQHLAERAVEDIIRDVLVPLLSHLNPAVQVISAMDILSKGLEAASIAHKVSRALHSAERRGARGLAGELVRDGIEWNAAASVDRTLTPTLRKAPELVLEDTSGRYAAARANQLPPPTRSWSVDQGLGR